MRCYSCQGIGHRSAECPSWKADKPALGLEEEEQDEWAECEEWNETEENEETVICYSLFSDKHGPDKPQADCNSLVLPTLCSTTGTTGPTTTGRTTAAAAAPGTLNALSGTTEQKTGWQKVWSYVDSGAARSVCPPTHASQFAVKPLDDAQRNTGFLTATGKRVQAIGGRTVEGVTQEGKKMKMNYTVAPVRMPLDSVSQICDSGATVIFTKTGGRIVDPSGTETAFVRDKDTYIREMWVPCSPDNHDLSTFRRQR